MESRKDYYVSPVAVESVTSFELPETVRQQGVMFTEEAVRQLGAVCEKRSEYTLDMAKQERPLIHYSGSGNIFQMLRFGIQSNNFKRRLEPLRADNDTTEELAKQMCGFRIKQGGSYQAPDSISLAKYSDDLYAPPRNILYLINPDIKTVGGIGDRNKDTGYGHGIDTTVVGEEYLVGNPTAYKDEVLGVNIILPKEIRAIVVGKYTSILSEMGLAAHDQIQAFFQEKNKNPRAGEDLFATIVLLAKLLNNNEIEHEAGMLEQEALQLTMQELSVKFMALQKKALLQFVGTDNTLNEATLRRALEQTFHIQILNK